MNKYKTLPPSKPGEINYDYFDVYTIAHFLIGTFYGSAELTFIVVFGLAVFWELIENSLKMYLPFLFPHATADTLKNSLGDVMAVLVGWTLITYFMKVLQI